MKCVHYPATGVRILGGISAAVLCLELALRVVASPGAPPYPDIASDSFDDTVVEWSQIEEGVSTSHYSEHGARVTGNEPTRSGTVAVIIGDSYVVGHQVGDRQTMGSRLEVIARNHGIPLDVRQYGWPGASPAQYLYVAGDVATRWRPSRVFVVVSANDFDGRGMFATPGYRVTANGSLRIVGDRAPRTGTPRGGSTLRQLAAHRWLVFQPRAWGSAITKWRGAGDTSPGAEGRSTESPPDSAEYARAPAAVVHALDSAFGKALTIVYLAQPGLRGNFVPDPSEHLLLSACARAAVDCVSTRDAMMAAARAGHASQGLETMRLGVGHLNPTGHVVLGRLMWEHLSVSASPE
jgi:hypothetical protein